MIFNKGGSKGEEKEVRSKSQKQREGEVNYTHGMQSQNSSIEKLFFCFLTPEISLD